jgi:signal transduction histidine kinase
MTAGRHNPHRDGFSDNESGATAAHPAIASDQVRSFADAITALVSAANPDALLQEIVEQTRQSAAASWVRLVLIDKRGIKRNMITAGTDRVLDVSVIRDTGITMRVIKSQAPFVIENANLQRDTVNPTLFDEGCGAALCMPLILEAEAIGVVWIHYTEPRPFQTDEVESLRHYVNMTAIVYGNARRQEELEKLHSLEELNRKKTAFLSTIAHEVRTPLAPVANCIDNLLTGVYGPVTTEQQSKLEVALSCIREADFLVDKLLHMASIETGHFGLALTNEPLRAVVERAVTFFMPELEHKGLRLAYKRGAEIAADIDLLKIVAVLKNILHNAIKFTDVGTIAVSVRRERAGGAHISISDTGIGIPSDELERIFMRFHKATNAPSHAGGTGIGLSIAKEFVELHGGRLSVKSAVGAGSTFSIRLPGTRS